MDGLRPCDELARKTFRQTSDEDFYFSFSTRERANPATSRTAMMVSSSVMRWPCSKSATCAFMFRISKWSECPDGAPQTAKWNQVPRFTTPSTSHRVRNRNEDADTEDSTVSADARFPESKASENVIRIGLPRQSVGVEEPGCEQPSAGSQSDPTVGAMLSDAMSLPMSLRSCFSITDVKLK